MYKMDPRVERWRSAVHAAFTLPPIDEAGVPVRVNVGPAHVRGFPQYVEEARRKPLFISESLRDARGGLLLRDGDGRIISLNDDRLGTLSESKVVGTDFFLKPMIGSAVNVIIIMALCTMHGRRRGDELRMEHATFGSC